MRCNEVNVCAAIFPDGDVTKIDDGGVSLRPVPPSVICIVTDTVTGAMRGSTVAGLATNDVSTGALRSGPPGTTAFEGTLGALDVVEFIATTVNV